MAEYKEKSINIVTIATIGALVSLLIGILTFHSIRSTNTDYVMGNKRTAGMFFFMLGVALMVFVVSHYYFVTLAKKAAVEKTVRAVLSSEVPHAPVPRRLPPPPDFYEDTNRLPGFRE